MISARLPLKLNTIGYVFTRLKPFWTIAKNLIHLINRL